MLLECGQAADLAVKVRTKIESSFRATPAKAGGDPESRNFKDIWMPVVTGMTAIRDLISSIKFGSQYFPAKLSVNSSRALPAIASFKLCGA